MARKLDPHRETARIVLEPRLVEAALGHLGGRLSSADQRIIVKATRTPIRSGGRSGGANTPDPKQTLQGREPITSEQSADFPFGTPKAKIKLRYDFGSPLMFGNGSTAIDGLSGSASDTESFSDATGSMGNAGTAWAETPTLKRINPARRCS
jgi:hypothetical protein